MTNQEIIDCNKLIAEFMGYKSTFLTKRWFVFGYIVMRYHSSWDWLMSVVDKIELLNHPVYIHGNTCTIYEKVGKDHGWEIEYVCSTKMESTYNAVVKFIKWYNKNK